MNYTQYTDEQLWAMRKKLEEEANEKHKLSDEIYFELKARGIVRKALKNIKPDLRIVK